MAHRADIVGGSTGQTCPGNGTCRRAPNGAPPRKQSFARTSACSCSGDKSCCRPVMTAVPADRAISPEPLTPKLLTS